MGEPQPRGVRKSLGVALKMCYAPHAGCAPFYRPLLLLILLMGFGLSFPLLTRYPFREDEAIYSFWALNFWQDPFFLTVWPDKPPVYPGALALAYKLFGLHEASARWLNISCTTLTVAMVATTARHLWGRRAALLAGATLALNPFTLSFAPTAYTDPLLVLLASCAFYAAIKQRCYWSGIWLGLAIMTKQQGLFYLPLVIGALGISTWLRHNTGRPSAHRPSQSALIAGSWFLCGLVTIIGPIVYWDSLRWAVAPSPWDLSLRNYGGLALLPADQWFTRGQSWGALAWYLLASRYLWLFVVGGIFYAAFLKFALRAKQPGRAARPFVLQPGAQPYRYLLSLWILGFATLHWISSIQMWDRYLLPLAAAGVLLWSGFLSDVTRKMPPFWGWGVSLLWLLLLCPPALQAVQGALPVGADHGDYEGLRPAIQWLEQEALSDAAHRLPSKVILYHNVLGWPLQFYLYQALQAEQIELRWFPSTFYLAHNATTAPHARKFVIVPNWAPVRNLAQFASMQKVALFPRVRFGQMLVVELVPQPRGFCRWCYCNGWLEPVFQER